MRARDPNDPVLYAVGSGKRALGPCCVCATVACLSASATGSSAGVALWLCAHSEGGDALAGSATRVAHLNSLTSGAEEPLRCDP